MSEPTYRIKPELQKQLSREIISGEFLIIPNSIFKEVSKIEGANQGISQLLTIAIVAGCREISKDFHEMFVDVQNQAMKNPEYKRLIDSLMQEGQHEI